MAALRTFVRLRVSSYVLGGVRHRGSDCFSISARNAPRFLCTPSKDGSQDLGEVSQSRPTGVLARLLAPPADGSRNRILNALGYYSSESRAIGVGNVLYKQALRRAESAVVVEAGANSAFTSRFEMLSVHIYLTLRRLRAEKGSNYEAEVKTAMQCLFDVFWTDVRSRMIIKEHGMKLIESGKWIKECEQMFFGMALAFDEAWESSEKLRGAIARNITCLANNPQRVEQFSKYMLREKLRLDNATVDQIWGGVCWDDQYPHPQSS